jgi:SpoVK/Ycf46/Vps4 family AAA+-type ATPase
LKEVVDAAGVEAESTMSFEESEEQSLAEPDMIDQPAARSAAAKLSSNQAFDLPGRPELTAFFNEHIVDIVRHQARYAALGIHFPGPFVLHGPPGCGKTFAIEQLTEFLGWPSFEINSASIASPYIHQTSKKISELFDAAIDAAPAVLVIDEMEAFLTDRDYGSGTHHIEEVSEFLRRIPEASKASVLIVAMTNRLEMIDPAILRRGRFDHVLKVDFANELEIRAMMEKLLSALPTAADVSAAPLAAQLIGRPLSDVAFIVREGARLAARAGKDVVDQRDLLAALQSAPAREREGQVKRRIGFV